MQIISTNNRGSETGCKSPDTPITYYSKNMRYPKKGGFKSFFNELVKDIDLHTNAEVSSINIETQTIKCTTPSGNISFSYDRLIVVFLCQRLCLCLKVFLEM